jgi:putative flippase GtrA
MHLFCYGAEGDRMSRSVVAYAIVSALCWTLSNAVLIAGDWANFPLSLSIGLSYSLVVVTGYVLHTLVSFKQHLALSAFARYAVAMSLNIPVAFAAVWLWRDSVGLPMLWAAPLATLCSTAINFVLSRWAISGRLETLTKPWANH